MITTWVQGTFKEFIKASQAGYYKGVASCTFWRHNDRSQRVPSDRSNQMTISHGSLLTECFATGVYRMVLLFHRKAGRAVGPRIVSANL